MGEAPDGNPAPHLFPTEAMDKVMQDHLQCLPVQWVIRLVQAISIHASSFRSGLAHPAVQRRWNIRSAASSRCSPAPSPVYSSGIGQRVVCHLLVLAFRSISQWVRDGFTQSCYRRVQMRFTDNRTHRNRFVPVEQSVPIHFFPLAQSLRFSSPRFQGLHTRRRCRSGWS